MKVSAPLKAHDQYGAGLIEIMIAMALGIVIVLGITTLFADASRSLAAVDRSGRQIENALFAVDLLSAELALAGYWGGANYPVDAETQIFASGEVPSELSWNVATEPPPTCLGAGGIISNTENNARAELAFAMEFPLFSALGAGLNSEITAGKCGLGLTALANASLDYFVIRRSGSCATGAPPTPALNQCRPLGDYFHLQANGCYSENLGLSGGEIKLEKVNEGNVLGLLSYTGFDCDSPAPIYRLVSRIYYIDQNDTMNRLYLDGAGGALGFRKEALVEGVELLRFEWFVDTSGDGEYDVVTRAPRVDDWPNIVGVKIWLVVRASQREPGYSDGAIYTIAGDSWSVPAGNESYRRVVQSRTVDIVNIRGRRQ
ncbi:MAG: PilW family protein [Luminiphilus sp.]|nr:PilW family protein [Luminiphilus sp.]